VRVYILKGVGIIPLDGSDDSKCFNELVLNDLKPVEYKSPKENKDGNVGKNPEFYMTYEYAEVTLPGSAYVKVFMKEKNLLGFGGSDIGQTSIDLEERIFSPAWNSVMKKPVEKRNIEHPGRGSRGRLEMWIDIIKPMNKEPPTIIYPKVQNPYELRVILWEAKDCVYKDEATESNDLYASGGVKRHNKDQETDTHWFCRATGSFNYRWKFEVMLPVDQNKNYGEDRFGLKLWDRDLIGANDLIGETDINLNDHKMLKKVVARQKPVQMKKRIKGSGLETNQFWVDVFHPEAVDEDMNKISQGKALISFEVLPKAEVAKFNNGLGRGDPNFYPTLPDPVGRFQFDLFSPLAMLKTILGPKLYRKICCYICCTLFMIIAVFVGYYVFTGYLSIKLAGL
jgi:hypothetical protein